MENVENYSKYLDPKVLARIGGLELRARLAVQGYFTGLHRSPYHGLSAEFVDHRSYAQGDDVRHVDWKLYGRTDKLYIKQYEQEINLNCMVVVDYSESMDYQSPEAIMSKRDYAACVAASLAYLALRQRDAVGVALFDESITSFIKPSSNPGQWKTVVGELDHQSARDMNVAARGMDLNIAGRGRDLNVAVRTSLRGVLEDLAERLQRRTLVILISDLFDDVAGTLLGLKHLRYQKHELIVCNIWDPAERRFPFKGPTMFDGLESTGRLLTEPQALRSRYLEEVDRFVTRLRRGCREMQIDYVPYDTSMALDGAISTYLATRSARIRHRSSRVLGGG